MPDPIISDQIQDSTPLTFPEMTDTPSVPAVPQDTGTTAQAPEPMDIPPIITGPSSPKRGKGKIIATILGILLLVGAVGAGVVLVSQKQLFKQKAAGQCPVINGCVADHPEQRCNDQGQMCTFYIGEPGSESDAVDCPKAGQKCVTSDGYCMISGNCHACIQYTECFYKDPDNCVADESCGGSPPTSTPTPTPTPRVTPTPTPPYRGCGEACNDYIHCIPSLNCPGGPSGGHCVNGLCPNDPDCVCAGTPTPTPPTHTATPTPRITPTPTPQPPMCSAVKAYDINWNLLTGAQLSALSAGSVVRFAVSGIPADQIDKARFTINGVLGPETTTKKPGTNEYYVEYTIPTGVTSFIVTAQIHHLTLGWF